MCRCAENIHFDNPASDKDFITNVSHRMLQISEGRLEMGAGVSARRSWFCGEVPELKNTPNVWGGTGRDKECGISC